MNFRKGSKRRAEPEINLIPFIDVLLVILIFLMVTTTYSRFTELQINLPTADANVAQQRPNEIQIGVDSRGNYKINQKPISKIDVADLAENLKKAASELAVGTGQTEPIVVINADGSASHQSVIDILEAARLAGLSKITFAAQSHEK
ncbi:ExbD/TolR family protein [Solimicrobium silvestre]|uniref:Biopolymer transport protein n=1 Tax=Solimicrobium silvestre TaxID=2099400 RepID=A0A2S9H4K4_9BURK|nr:biopolymer transporter ExbD [Solimicrobium silvestre]PRC94909.1 Biopolymer transport protein [Solimicrobium silvestre]